MNREKSEAIRETLWEIMENNKRESDAKLKQLHSVVDKFSMVIDKKQLEINDKNDQLTRINST